MLVLTRRVNERIQVGDVTITVVRLGSRNVRIGIDAPADVPISRTELLEGSVPEPRTLNPEPSHAEAAA